MLGQLTVTHSPKMQKIQIKALALFILSVYRGESFRCIGC